MVVNQPCSLGPSAYSSGPITPRISKSPEVPLKVTLLAQKFAIFKEYLRVRTTFVLGGGKGEGGRWEKERYQLI